MRLSILLYCRHGAQEAGPILGPFQKSETWTFTKPQVVTKIFTSTPVKPDAVLPNRCLKHRLSAPQDGSVLKVIPVLLTLIYKLSFLTGMWAIPVCISGKLRFQYDGYVDWYPLTGIHPFTSLTQLGIQEVAATLHRNWLSTIYARAILETWETV